MEKETSDLKVSKLCPYFSGLTKLVSSTSQQQDLCSQLRQQKEELEAQIYRLTSKLYIIHHCHQQIGLPSHTQSVIDLRNYILTLPLPSTIFEITKNVEQSYSFLLKTGILPLSINCTNDNEEMIISYTDRLGFIFLCQTCGQIEDCRKGTLWNISNLTLPSLVLAIFGWCLSISVARLARLVGDVERHSIYVSRNLSILVSRWFNANFQPLNGVIEIDESKFYDRKKAKNLKKAWVMGFYERHTGRLYMEAVVRRDTKTLLPIISERCAPGSTIISDQWAVYNKLGDMGYYHYTVDHSRFFVNPHNREINTQHIELSWLWAKRDIKNKDKNGWYFQTYLNEYCWRKQFKDEDKCKQVAAIMKEVCYVLKEYREGNPIFKDLTLFPYELQLRKVLTKEMLGKYY